ncbi:hypothetical protein N0V90_011620 [Kalmusia sp. IMI 367209]|nr:hypothetical protein N0V90_011620 [Kalmusia sp. IMI 367209]
MYPNELLFLALAGTAMSHMHLAYPPTLKGDNNPFTEGTADPYLNYNYGCCGREVPGVCKGHLDLLESDEGRPVVTWAPGQKVNFTLSGEPINIPGSTEKKGGTHYGGSCSVGFSTDKGKTFKIATTWQGDCPHRDGTIDPSTQSFDFTVPADIPSGERTIFAWTWVNREKEFNMNCAIVTIASSGNSEQPENLPTSSHIASKPSFTSSVVEQPSQTKTSSAQPTGSAQYTLQGCTCSCPYQTWSPACSCYECKSSATKRHIVERKALELHKRHLQNVEKLNIPVRRAEMISWNNRPNMLVDIDFPGAKCHSMGDPFELEFPNPGPDVIEGDGEYRLAPPDCS